MTQKTPETPQNQDQNQPVAGYRLHDPSLPTSPIDAGDFAAMKEAALFGPSDVEALRASARLLVPRTEEILDVWYGFVGSKPFLLEHFSHRATGAPIEDYLGRVRARFAKWIEDTAAAEYDDDWLRWQLEIGRRHHRVGKNKTDGAESSAIIPFRYLTLLAQPIVHTLRPFLEAGGDDHAAIEAMHDAWRKSVLLQVTLWSFPYIKEGDY
jgi:hypothetical protein